MDNVKWWGRVDSGYITCILKQSDILLLTYKAEEYREQLASPHKLLEYLNSGRVTVATIQMSIKIRESL